MKPYHIQQTTQANLCTPHDLYTRCIRYLAQLAPCIIDRACGVDQIRYRNWRSQTEDRLPDLFYDGYAHYRIAPDSTVEAVVDPDLSQIAYFCNPPGGAGAAAKLKYQILDAVLEEGHPTLWLIYNINALAPTLRRISGEYSLLIFDNRLKWEPKQADGAFFGSALVGLNTDHDLFTEHFQDLGTVLKS